MSGSRDAMDVADRDRADVILVMRGLFASRAKAQEAIAAGLVTADGVVLRKASDRLPQHAVVAAAAPHPWVSRGGVKLAAALDALSYDPADLICLDAGASTGGFTHVLLARGARRVYAIDVGHGQLDPAIASDRRVVVLERTDARALTREQIAVALDMIVVDVSFISLKLVLPALVPLLAGEAALIALIKPQFEAGRSHLRKGIVRDAAVRQSVCNEIAAFVRGLGFAVDGIVPSPIQGGDGNEEFLIGARRDADRG